MIYSPEKIQETLTLVRQKKNILIITHVSPDGDAIGSTLGFQKFLHKLGIAATVMTPDNFPDNFKWMSGSEEIQIYNGNEPQAEEIIRKADLIFTLDFNDLKRCDSMENGVGINTCPKIMIDHHREPKDYAFITFSDTGASSTCEMVFNFIEHSGNLHVIDSEMAACLYTGIMTDTGSFRHASTTPHTHSVVGKLLDTGMDLVAVGRAVNDTNSYNRLQLLGYMLTHKMVYLPEYSCIFMSLTKEEMEKFGYQAGDSEGFVNYGLSVKGVIMSVLFKEGDGKTKISFRSKGDFSVQQLASKHFNGGGHYNAAGGSSVESVEKTVERFVATLEEYKDALNFV